MKYDLSALDSQYHSAAVAAIGKANAFAAAAQTGVQFKTDGPNDRKVSFVINTSGSGPGAALTSHTNGVVTGAEVRLNPEARFDGDNTLVLSPSGPRYNDALVLVFFHELLHTMGLNNVGFGDSTFGGSIMNESLPSEIITITI